MSVRDAGKVVTTPALAYDSRMVMRSLPAAGGRRPLLECSGGITIDTAAAYAASGVDLLSTSQITQSAPALDLGLDL